MKLLFASDSFKGTLSSEQTIDLLKKLRRKCLISGKVSESPWPMEEREQRMR